jgi:hypothetical protein
MAGDERRRKHAAKRRVGRVIAGVAWVIVDPLGSILVGIEHVAAMPDQRKQVTHPEDQTP